MAMLSLNDREWRTFYISNEKVNGLFTIRASLSGIDKNKLIDSQNSEIPYITRSDFNNGVSFFVGREQKEKYRIDVGNVITIGLDTQTVFYQPYFFYTGQNIQILYNESLNKYIAKFLIPLLRMQVSKLSWGGNGATLGRLKRMQILLPVNSEGNPDYDFMEQYIREREEQLIQKYKDFIKEISQTQRVTPNPIKWREFFIGDIFDVKRPKPRTERQYQAGEIPFIASGNINNGVVRFCNTQDDECLDEKNCITVSPVDGSAFYQGFNFLGRGGAGSSILLLYNDHLNKYIGLFISRVIRHTCSKYNYGRMGNQESIRREKILLPVDEDGNPDYAYMEWYCRQMIAQRYHQYLNYISER